MFVLQCKPLKHKKAVFIGGAALLLVICVALFAACHRRTPADTARAGDREYSLKAENGGYSAFFSQLGIETDGEPCARQTVTIPGEFNEVYEAYNELQRHAGLNLTRYRGEEAEKLTFSVRSGKMPYAVILVRQGRVIGGHLTDGEYGSEPLPLI